MSRLGKQHWEAVKWILRYLKGSSDTCFYFTGVSLKLQDYVDADFAGDIDSRKSTIGFILLRVIQLYHGLQICKRLSLCLLQKLSML